MIIWGSQNFSFSATRPENINPWQSNGGLALPTPTQLPFGRKFPRRPPKLAFIPERVPFQVVPRPDFTAEISSRHEVEAALVVSVSAPAGCAAAALSTLTVAVSAAVHLQSHADASSSPVSAAALTGSAVYSATYGTQGRSSARPAAQAELEADPKNKRPLSDKEILDLMEALAKRPRK